MRPFAFSWASSILLWVLFWRFSRSARAYFNWLRYFSEVFLSSSRQLSSSDIFSSSICTLDFLGDMTALGSIFAFKGGIAIYFSSGKSMDKFMLIAQ